MADGGEVSRDSVIVVLEAAGVSMTKAGATVTLFSKDGDPEVYYLPQQVGRRMLHRLANKYGVPTEWFYHPEMACKASKTKQ